MCERKRVYVYYVNRTFATKLILCDSDYMWSEGMGKG